LPAVAAKLLAVLDDESVSLGEISRLIQLDVAFSAEVLRMANSALFPRRFEVLNVLHGVSTLGVERIRSLILTLALRDLLTSKELNRLVHLCWRHSLASALVSESLAEILWNDRPTAYTAGLLHDIGRLALITVDPIAYSAVVANRGVGEQCLAESEWEIFGVDSANVKLELARKWHLPDKLMGGHCCQSGVEFDADNELDRTVALGCRVACHLGFTIRDQPSEVSPAKFKDSLPHWAREQVADRLDEFAGSLLLRLNAFECEFMSPCLK
jgi:HD-like signal output (HDOD) protein